MSDFSKKLILKLVENADSENVFFMEKYMKNQFRFLGIKQDTRRKIFNNFIKEYGLPDKAHFETLIKELFGNDFRESQYCGMELMKKMKKYWDVKSIDLIEYLILEKAWWDTVDFISLHLAGDYFQMFPKEIPLRIERWMNSGNRWLQRAAILYQLKYKEQTQVSLLLKCVSVLASSKEFFIRKACGWALRELSKTNPQVVKEFILSHNLSGLTRREASKYIEGL